MGNLCAKTCGVCGERVPIEVYEHAEAEAKRKGKSAFGVVSQKEAATFNLQLPKVFVCMDVQPPKYFINPTCELQLVKTRNCRERRKGMLKDDLCAKTCG